MPTLDWLDSENAFRIAERVPTRVLRPHDRAPAVVGDAAAFYPDFVCDLIDGRLLVVEYKGAQIASMPKEIEKGEVGRLWVARSEGRCLFALVLKDREGLNVAQQLEAAMS